MFHAFFWILVALGNGVFIQATDSSKDDVTHSCHVWSRCSNKPWHFQMSFTHSTLRTPATRHVTTSRGWPQQTTTSSSKCRCPLDACLNRLFFSLNSPYNFLCQASKDALVALSWEPWTNATFMYEVNIGQDNNRFVIIRKDGEVQDSKEHQALLSPDELRAFWISWYD